MESHLIAVHGDPHAAATRSNLGIATLFAQSLQIPDQPLHVLDAAAIVHIPSIRQYMHPDPLGAVLHSLQQWWAAENAALQWL